MPPGRAELGAKAQGMVNDGREVYVFFKHEESPAVALHAEELLRGVH